MLSCSAMISELFEEPIEMPEDLSSDFSKEYRRMTMDFLAEMHLLCPHDNISGDGSTPVFTEFACEFLASDSVCLASI